MIEIDKEKISRVGKDIGQVANYYRMKFKNDMWLYNLGRSEQAMISDVKHEFMLNKFGGNEELLKKTSKLYSDYLDIITAYNQMNSLDLNTRMKAYSSGYNLSLTLEEACQVYLKCSKSEAEQAYNRYFELESMFQEYLSRIRKNYRSSLGVLLGKSDQEYQSSLPEITGTLDPDAAKTYFDALKDFDGKLDPHAVKTFFDALKGFDEKTFDTDAGKAYFDALDEFGKKFSKPTNSAANIVDESIKSSFGK